LLFGCYRPNIGKLISQIGVFPNEWGILNIQQRFLQASLAS
jgi:hypothetical protein